VSTEGMFDSVSKKCAASKQSAVSFACAVCFKSLSSMRGLRIHQSRKHKESSVTGVNVKNQGYRAWCEYCFR